MEKIKKAGISALRWTEQYTKTDMLYLAHGGFWNILSQVIVSSSTLLLAIAFAHFVSKEVYGEYKYVLSIASILGTFTLSGGLGAAITQSVNRGFEGTLMYAFWKNLQWSVLFFILALGMGIYYFVNGNMSLGICMLIIGSFSPFWNSTNLYSSYLEAKKDFRRNAIYFNIIGNLFPVICLCIGIILIDKPLWLVLIYFASNTIIGFILYIKILNIYKPNNNIDTGALSYSKHLSLMSILGGIVSNLDQILVFHYIGATELAIYNFATAIPGQIKGPMKGLSSLMFPKYTERDDKEIRHGMKNKLLLSCVGGVMIIILYIVTTPYIFRIFFPKYTDAIFYSQIFSISLLWVVSIPTNTYLLAKKKIKEQYISNIAGPIIHTVLLFIGILWWGLLGLIVARVISNLISTAISIILYEKASK